MHSHPVTMRILGLCLMALIPCEAMRLRQKFGFAGVDQENHSKHDDMGLTMPPPMPMTVVDECTGDLDITRDALIKYNQRKSDKNRSTPVAPEDDQYHYPCMMKQKLFCCIANRKGYCCKCALDKEECIRHVGNIKSEDNGKTKTFRVPVAGASRPTGNPFVGHNGALTSSTAANKTPVSAAHVAAAKVAEIKRKVADRMMDRMIDGINPGRMIDGLNPGINRIQRINGICLAFLASQRENEVDAFLDDCVKAPSNGDIDILLAAKEAKLGLTAEKQ